MKYRQHSQDSIVEAMEEQKLQWNRPVKLEGRDGYKAIKILAQLEQLLTVIVAIN